MRPTACLLRRGPPSSVHVTRCLAWEKPQGNYSPRCQFYRAKNSPLILHTLHPEGSEASPPPRRLRKSWGHPNWEEHPWRRRTTHDGGRLGLLLRRKIITWWPSVFSCF